MPFYFIKRLGLFTARFQTRVASLMEVVRRPSPPTPVWDLAFALLDLLGICDLYEVLSNSFAPNTRPLSTRERALLQAYFGDSLPYDLIRIDERARIGCKQRGFYYVSFHTINSWGPMPDWILVHEAMHVWQYTQHGAAYIPRALWVQGLPQGYNYGGLAELERHNCLADFNYEQQADIVMDAYRLSRHLAARWAPGAGAEALHHYLPYLRELSTAKAPA